MIIFYQISKLLQCIFVLVKIRIVVLMLQLQIIAHQLVDLI